MATLVAIKYKDGCLELLDQLKLPHQTTYIQISTLEDGWNAIHQMNVTFDIFFQYKLQQLIIARNQPG